HSRLPRSGSKRRLRSHSGLGSADRFRQYRRWLRFEPLEDRRLLAVTISEFPGNALSSGVNGITTGADGNLWFTEQTQTVNNVSTSRIGMITPAGVATEYEIPTSNAFA